jgi:competence CoiA-like predicted nuclease
LLYALDSSGNQVSAEKTSQEAKCPYCGNRVISKCGMIKIYHWAHKVDCSFKDSWNYEPMSQWHLDWQELFTNTQREAYIEKEGITHRADILTNTNVVIEIQNSSISVEDIRARCDFYDNLVWVINSQEFKHNLDLFNYNSMRKLSALSIPCYEREIGQDYYLYIYLQKDKWFNYFDEILELNLFIKVGNNGEWRRQIKINKTDRKKEILKIINSIEFDLTTIGYYSDWIKFAPNDRQETFLCWNYFRKSWKNVLSENTLLFIDLNNGFLFQINRLKENGRGWGEFVPKEQFIKKYNAQ